MSIDNEDARQYGVSAVLRGAMSLSMLSVAMEWVAQLWRAWEFQHVEGLLNRRYSQERKANAFCSYILLHTFRANMLVNYFGLYNPHIMVCVH